jgi:hypothetical protein
MTGSHYLSQAALELAILLPEPLECCDYRRVSQHPSLISSSYKRKLILWNSKECMKDEMASLFFGFTGV